MPDQEPEVTSGTDGGAAAAPKAPEKSTGRGGRIARAWGSAILAVLGVLCLVLTPVTIWGRNLVLNTDRYVSTMAPLAANPGVQDVVIQAVDKQVQTHLNVKSFVDRALPKKAAKRLGGVLQHGVYELVDAVTTKFVQSPSFQKLWNGMNRLTHEQIVNLLTGTGAHRRLHIEKGKVVLDVSPVVAKVTDKLKAAGIAVASKVPVTGTTIEIANAKGLTSAQKLVKFLNTLADWLWLVGLALVAAGVALARRHRRALVLSAVGLAFGMVVLGVGLLLGRQIYLSEVPTSILPRDTATFVYDTLIRYLRWGIRGVFVVAIVVALIAWASGNDAVRRGLRKLGGDREVGPAARWVQRYAWPLRVAVVALAGIVLLMLSSPSLTTVIVLVVVVLILLGVVEILRAPARRSPGVAPA